MACYRHLSQYSGFQPHCPLKYVLVKTVLKTAAAYGLHIIATLAIPLLARLSSTLVYALLRHGLTSAATPQQFYSDHMFVIIGFTGLWFGYAVCDTFTSKGALWAWLPFTVVFLVRVLSWKEAGSVLLRSDVINHFFTANCQLQGWQEPDFVSRCSDKLFMTPLFVAGMAYMLGAAIQRLVRRRTVAITVSESSS
jgi:hypothetical protein